MIVPAAMPLKTLAPMMNIPAIAIHDGRWPETTTVRPDVRAVRSSASCDGSPRFRSARERMM
jgi:hypothetical protein